MGAGIAGGDVTVVCGTQSHKGLPTPELNFNLVHPLDKWHRHSIFTITLSMLTQEILKSILTYEEETGIFRRKQPASNMTVGSVAGSLGKNGWIRIKINNKRYAAHKLAWLYVYGEFPKMDIDHRNRIRSDNRIRNLRLATKNQNQHNQTLSTASSTRLKGVTLHKKSGKYQAQIKHFGKKIYLGLYATSEGASVAYEAASRKLFGQFSYNA